MIEKPARIEVSTIMGGVEIYVPGHWSVKTDVLPIMGGVDDNRTMAGPRDEGDPSDQLPDLVVSGTVLIGGLAIKG